MPSMNANIPLEILANMKPQAVANLISSLLIVRLRRSGFFQTDQRSGKSGNLRETKLPTRKGWWRSLVHPQLRQAGGWQFD
jgi:hypothetical protein